MGPSRSFRVALFLTVSLIGAGCGGGDERGPDTSAGAPKIVRFEANPQRIEAGAAAVLSWQIEGATEISIDADGAAVDLGSVSVSNGSVEVRPAATTRYTLTAKGDGGKTATASTSVEVGPADAPTIDFSAKRPRIDFGSSTELVWSTTGATRVVIKGGIDVVLDTAEAAGARTVSPSSTTLYELTASGPGGQISKTVSVEVAPVVSAFEADVEGPVGVGTMVALRWETLGADSVKVSSPDGYEYVVPEDERSAGATVTIVGASGVFELTARRDGIPTVARIELELRTGPWIESFTASSTVVTGNTEVILSWAVQQAAFVSIEAEPGGSVIVQDPLEVGEARWTVSSDTRFRLIATGHDSSVETAEIEVRWFAPPVIDSFSALPGRVGMGEQVTLAWTTSGGAERVEIRTGQGPAQGPLPADGSIQVPVTADTIFTLRAFNGAGVAVERTAAVTVGAPTIVSFSCDGDQVRPGSPLHFSWTNVGGSSLQILGPDGPVAACATTDPAVIAEGSCTVAAPTTEGPNDFTLVVTNRMGDRSEETVRVRVRVGPMILSFAATEIVITEGDDATFEWTVGPDTAGEWPVLSLSDDRGGSYPIDDPASGRITVTPAGNGHRTFTLTATSAGDPPDFATEVIDIEEGPSVSLTASSEEYTPALGPVSLSWSATGAVRVQVFELDTFGNPVLPALKTAVSPAEVAAGSVQVRPTRNTTYRAVASNRAQAEARSEVVVGAPALQIVSFTATPDTITAPGRAKLEWQTVGAAWVELDVPKELTLQPATEPFLDISDSPTKFTTPPHNCGTQFADEGCIVVTFPDDFAFPFDGQLHTQAMLFHNGFVGFDLGFTGINYTNQTIPSPQYTHASLVPFWDDIAPGPGALYYDTGWDDRGQFMVVQWHHFTGAYQSDDMNFQLVMWDDGSFDFRYHTMRSQAGTTKADGDSATIGWQNLTGTAGYQISKDTVVPGGLSNTGYSFRVPELSTDGAIYVTPAATRTYTLTAHGFDGSQVSRTVTVHVN